MVEAESEAEALNAIAHARCTGSTGHNRTVIENGIERVVATVVRLT